LPPLALRSIWRVAGAASSLAIVFVWPMHAIGASGGRPYSTVAQEMTGDTADDRTF
jgi:hypothetical protein